MKRRDFVGVVTAMVSGTTVASEIIGVSHEAWSKHLDTRCEEMIFCKQSGQWHKFIKVSLKEIPVKYEDITFSLQNAKWYKIEVLHMGNDYMVGPFLNEAATTKLKQDLVDAAVKENPNYPYRFFEVTYKNVTGLVGL